MASRFRGRENSTLPARFSHIPTAPAPTGFSGALRRRSHGNVQKPPPPRIPLRGQSGSSASSSAPLPPPAPCSLLPLRKTLNAGAAWYKDALLRPCDRPQGRPTHLALPCIRPQSIDHVQAPLFSHVVERFCPVTGASLIGNAPDCSHCLNTAVSCSRHTHRCLFQKRFCR